MPVDKENFTPDGSQRAELYQKCRIFAGTDD
jgi:hypothetical protein